MSKKAITQSRPANGNATSKAPSEPPHVLEAMKCFEESVFNSKDPKKDITRCLDYAYHNPEAWNTIIEHSITENIRPSRRNDPYLFIGPDLCTSRVAWVSGMHISADICGNTYIDSDTVLYRNHIEELSKVQCSLSFSAAKIFGSGHPFEQKWKEKGVEGRRKCVIEGMVRACANWEPNGWIPMRGTCDDILVADLVKDDGKWFLELLDKYVWDDLPLSDTSGVIPHGMMKTYENPLWRATFLYGAIKAAQSGRKDDVWARAIKAHRNLRDRFLGTFLHRTLQAYLSMPAAPRTDPSHPAIKRTEPPIFAQDTGLGLGTEMPFTDPKRKKLAKQEHKLCVRACETYLCRMLESESKDGEYMKCKRCIEKIGRSIYYCSKECQVDDWPRHKRICGKTLTYDEIDEHAITSPFCIASTNRKGQYRSQLAVPKHDPVRCDTLPTWKENEPCPIGRSRPRFKKTRYILFQIVMLAERDEAADYYVIFTCDDLEKLKGPSYEEKEETKPALKYKARPVGFSGSLKIRFQALRSRAFAYGLADEEAIKEMTKMVLCFVANSRNGFILGQDGQDSERVVEESEMPSEKKENKQDKYYYSKDGILDIVMKQISREFVVDIEEMLQGWQVEV